MTGLYKSQTAMKHRVLKRGEMILKASFIVNKDQENLLIGTLKILVFSSVKLWGTDSFLKIIWKYAVDTPRKFQGDVTTLRWAIISHMETNDMKYTRMSFHSNFIFTFVCNKLITVSLSGQCRIRKVCLTEK